LVKVLQFLQDVVSDVFFLKFHLFLSLDQLKHLWDFLRIMARNIIIFVADGLRPGSVNAIDTPTLFSIRQNGVNFTDSHSLFPTFTTPNASAIATGHYLGDTGDFSNTVYTGYPVINSNGTVTPFIENDPILADINANSNLADPDGSFSKNNFLTEESILAYARLNGYSTAAIGKLGPVAIFDVTQDTRTGGTTTPNITPKTVIIDDSTRIDTIANATNPPVNGVGSQSGIPLSAAIANDLNNAGLIGQNIPGTTTLATTIGSIRNNQPAGNSTTAGTLNANTQQQQYLADVTTKAVLPQFVSDIASNTSKGFAAVYWSRDPDGSQHNNGDAFNAADPGNNSLTIGINGPTSKKGVQDADANLKQLIDYLKATPDPANPGKTLYDNTDIFLTADHGFSTISKQAVGVTFDAAGTPTYIKTTSYAASLTYAGVHAGFLPPGFVAIDLAKDLGSTLFDPNKPTAPVTTANISNIQYTAVDPTKGELTTSGNGVIGGSGKVVNGVIDSGTKVVVAANGGSDLLYVPSNDPALVKQIVSFLAQKDYISGIFTDDKFGDVPGALKLSTIGLEGTAELPTPSIVINFKTFSTNPNNPNDPQAQVEVADTTLQQGQGMHGSFGRGDTFNNMAAIGPDFKAGYVDNAPVSNADIVPTLANILGWNIPSVGTLNGRVISEALVNGPAITNFSSASVISTPVNGQSTILKTQTVGNTQYFDVAGFAGGTDGLATTTFKSTGPSSSQTPYILPTAPGVQTSAILTVGDAAPNGYKLAGIPDGLGAFDNGDGTFTLLVNHEIGNTLGVARASGGKGAFVSSWVINKSDLSVVSGNDLIQKVYNWDAITQKSNTTTSIIDFNRFCSADLAPVSAFYNSATGLGTAERLFLNGEEGGATGYQVATVASGANKGSAYILGKFNLSTNGSGLTGVGGWENAVANPFAQDKTIVIADNDGGTGIMSNSVAVYVGTKTKTGTDVEKAGLTNGTLKFVNVTGNPVEITDTTTRATNITNGAAFTLSGTASTTFSRPEDGAWNPSNPKQYFFVTTDRLDTVNDGLGTQIGRSRLWALNFTDITNPDAGGTIDLLLDGTEGQNMFDNISVDRYGHITLLEDTGNAAHNGKVWQYDIATDKLSQLTKFDPARFGDVVNGVATPATAPFTIDEETSGVIDAQDILGPGWSLIDVQAHYPNADPSLVEGGQLLALYNPTTANSAATAKNKVAFSGVAAGDATTSSEILWTRTVDAVTKQGIQANLNVQLSKDSTFGTIDKTYTSVSSDPNRDYTVKLDATGLQSGTKYYYRFVTTGGDTSAVGTFKTALDANAVAPVRFGFSGDADGLLRPYSSTQDFGKLNLDFFGFLGDTIYETASTGSAATVIPTTDANASQALVDYHRKYLENLQPVNNGGFSSLQTLYASQGNYTLLDNHELGNRQLINGGAPIALQTDPTTVNRNGTTSVTPAGTNAYDTNTTGTYINDTLAFKTLEQAYLDYQPVRENIISAPNDPRTDGTQQLYEAQQWGKNLIYVNTDSRTYRDARLKQADGTTDDTGARADNPDRTYFGKTQVAWIKQTLLDSQKNGTTWKFVAISDPIDQIGAIGSGEDGGKSLLGGYRAERNDLLKFIADNGIKNVVFLSTDDHQNRINELTYLDNINDPTSVKVLPGVISVVDGPIGATGPNTITDHSFANIKSLADALATKQTAAGVNPVGLSPTFAGLKNVVREGDPNADTLRQAVDFYSPDTFNYTTFDISADGKTLNVNVQGINSYATNTFPEPSAANPVHSILSFSLDAAPAVLSVAAPTSTATETNSTPGTFRVTSDIPANVPLTFGYTVGGTATNGSDYTSLTGTATIAAGQSSVDIAVTPVDDLVAEGNETVTLKSGTGAGYVTNASSSVATVTIIDNEPAPIGTSGNDNLVAIPGSNFDGQSSIVFTGAGNDQVDLALSPVAKNNRINLGAGTDSIFVSQGDRVFGGAGNDTFDATDGRGGNRMSGGAGDDAFFLGKGDRALGGDGNDKFYVQTGGDNLLSGGVGNDQFWIVNAELPSRSNTILDFQVGTDVIGISGAASLGISATTLKLNQVGADTTITFGSQTLSVLSGIQSTDLNLSNSNQFIFT
jgi:phosphodiesterase/alkaline phosphatase D-like protein/arylsulfatase A-like enzyme